jgi:hypothetical protein
MAVEVIEGDLQPSEPAGGKKKYARYKSLTITQPGGHVRSFSKIAAGHGMIDEIRRGGQGRWYVAKVDGVTAFAGVRRADGTAVYAKHTNFEPVVLVVGLLGCLGGVVKFGLGVEEFPLTPVVLGPFLLIGWYYFRSKRLEQERVFAADAA